MLAQDFRTSGLELVNGCIPLILTSIRAKVNTEIFLRVDDSESVPSGASLFQPILKVRDVFPTQPSSEE